MNGDKYIYVFKFDKGWNVPKFTIEKVKVKGTLKQYRCIEDGKAPFCYSKQVDKSNVDNKAIKSYSDIYYYSSDSNIEVFRNKVIELLESEIEKHKAKILELQDYQEIVNRTINEQYNV